MPATETTNIEITYIQTSQAGKETTANNAFDKIDGALGSVYAYEMPSNANQTPDDATCLISLVIHVTSAVTLTATRNITLPNNKKFYFVKNSTTGSQNIQFKTAAGTGVTVANGKEAIVRCDGTNIVRAGPEAFAPADGNFLVNGGNTSGMTGSFVDVTNMGGSLDIYCNDTGTSVLTLKTAATEPATSPFVLYDGNDDTQFQIDSEFNVDLMNHRIVNLADAQASNQAASSSQVSPGYLTFGALTMATANGTYYLAPGMYAATAPTSGSGDEPVFIAPADGVLSFLQVREHAVTHVTGTVTYTVRKNGSADATLQVALTTGVGSGSDVTGSISVSQGDRIGMQAVVTGGPMGTAPRMITASLKFTLAA